MCDCLLSGLNFSAGCVGGGGVILVRQDDKNTWEFVTIFSTNLTRSIINIFLVLVLVRYDLGSSPGCCSLGSTPCHTLEVFHPLQPMPDGSVRVFLPLLEGCKIVLTLIVTVS